MNAPLSAIEQLHLELPGLDWITEPSRVARLSQDFAWFSPVLDRQLKDKRADAVARPRTEDEIRAVVSACARRKVPITIRGSGAGLAYQILQAGFQLNIPRMFAALLLISLTGVALFAAMAWATRRALGSWHASETSHD